MGVCSYIIENIILKTIFVNRLCILCHIFIRVQRTSQPNKQYIRLNRDRDIFPFTENVVSFIHSVCLIRFVR